MRRWRVPRVDEALACGLAERLGVSRVLARLLVARGYDAATAERFLSPSADDLHSPWLMSGMELAARRLRRAIDQREPILLCGDYDVDGTLAVVVLLTAIRLAGGEADYHVPHRIKDGYGIRPEVVERAAASGVRLLVSVDTGIRAVEAVQRASALGIDVIITDHHLPEGDLPPALSVLNPNRPGCRYPNKDLCGAGIAYKLATALLEGLDWPPGKAERVSQSLLKLVAVATVADLVPLREENRVLVALGLAGLRERKHPGLAELLRVAGIAAGEAPSARQVGFQIGPRINAAGRMEDARQVVELLTTADAARAAEIAGHLDQLNQERQQLEQRIRDEIFQRITEPPPGMVLAGEHWRRGVAGIVASRVVERYHRPVFVLEIDRAQGVAVGSGRSIPGFHLLEALESMRDLFQKFGGHQFAAGVTVPLDRVAEFQRRFEEFAASRLSAEDLAPELRLDGEAALADFGPDLLAEIERMQPFGHGNPEPLWLVRDLRIEAVRPMGGSGRHFRLTVEQGGRRALLKLWDFAARDRELVAGRRIDGAVRIEADSYSGWSISARDLREAL